LVGCGIGNVELRHFSKLWRREISFRMGLSQTCPLMKGRLGSRDFTVVRVIAAEVELLVEGLTWWT
jgi:hypothetical protein